MVQAVQLRPFTSHKYIFQLKQSILSTSLSGISGHDCMKNVPGELNCNVLVQHVSQNLEIWVKWRILRIYLMVSSEHDDQQCIYIYMYIYIYVFDR